MLIKDFPKHNMIQNKVEFIILINLKELIVMVKSNMKNCGWTWDVVTGGNDPYNYHKCGLDNSPELDIDTIQEINI